MAYLIQKFHQNISFGHIIVNMLFELIIVGAMAGVLSGWLGIGGGIIIVPTLAYLFQHVSYPVVPPQLIIKMAIASSLFSILFNSLASARSHHYKGSLRWDILKKWGVALCIGAIIGSIAATWLGATVLRYLFAFFLLGVAIKLFAGKWLPQVSLSPRTVVLFPIGLIAGFLSGLLGVGGGVLMIPVLIGLGCTMSESAGTSSSSTIPLALVAGVSFMITGYLQGVSIPYSTGYIYWPAVLVVGIMGVLFAPLGVKLSYKVPEVWTKRALGLLLLGIVTHMLV
jgi:uncharacterized membrane protein YfcA